MELWYRAESCINNLSRELKIKFETPSQHSAIFLDLQIYRDGFNKKIQTAIYQKPLNKYSYITPSSAHEPKMFSGFIKGELTRYARLSSTVFAYQEVKNKFKERLIARGYKRSFISKLFVKHTWSKRFSEPPQSDRKILPFVIPYSLRKNQDLLKQLVYANCKQLEDLLDSSRVLVCYSKRRNLSQMLCPSALTRDQRQLLVTKRYQHATRGIDNISSR